MKVTLDGTMVAELIERWGVSVSARPTALRRVDARVTGTRSNSSIAGI